MMMKEYPLFVNDSGAPKDYMEKYMTNVSLFIVTIRTNPAAASSVNQPIHGASPIQYKDNSNQPSSSGLAIAALLTYMETFEPRA